MMYRLLAGGYRDTFVTLTFDPSTAKIKVLAEPKAPKNASWLERSVKQSTVVYTLSEDENGQAASLEVNKDSGDLKITRQRPTNGGPAHVHAMKDGSGIVVANYVGGSIIFFPVDSAGLLAETSESPNLKFPFTYEAGKAPNKERQDEPHPHQVIEGAEGRLYVPDLGNDRIWVVKRTGESGLDIEGWLQVPEGLGPRHAVISQDEKNLYILTEMSSRLLHFSVPAKSYPAHPTPTFSESIVPPSVPEDRAYNVLNAAELIAHPVIPNVLYASNRLELNFNKDAEKRGKQPVDTISTEGDAVAVIQLSADGQKVENKTFVRTGCDQIRAMQISLDGKYVALAGQTGGGVEIWHVEGEKGDQWKLAAKDESIKSITDFVWL